MEYGPRTTFEILQEIQKILDDRQKILNILKVESSSCQRSTISIGQRKEIKKSVLGIPKKSRTRKKVSAWTLVIFGPGDQDTWWRTSRKLDTQFSEVSVR